MLGKYPHLSLAAFPLLLVGAGLLVDPLGDIVMGLFAIVQAPSLLLTDYLAVGGAGATLVNAGLCGLIAVWLIYQNKINVNGPFTAAVYTVIGFAFFGKNIVNIWPVLAGVWLYARYIRTGFRDYLLVGLFGTTLAPLASYLAVGAGLPYLYAIPLGVLGGVVSGFVLPPLASHMLRFHDGFNIYNIGFTGGIVGSFLSAVFRGFGLHIEAGEILTDEYSRMLGILLNGCFVAMIGIGLWRARKEPGELRDAVRSIYKSSGRLVSDFMRIGNQEATIINMGVMGLVSSAFVLLLGGAFNGPVIGGMLTVVGFAAFGKHLKNCLPILIGVTLASFITQWETGATAVIIAGLFGTTLAPVAGQFGFRAGVAAGFFHLCVVMNVGWLHGGMNLYNNGFAGGFVASFLVPVFVSLKRKDKNNAR